MLYIYLNPVSILDWLIDVLFLQKRRDCVLYRQSGPCVSRTSHSLSSTNHREDYSDVHYDAYHTVCVQCESLEREDGVVGLHHHITNLILYTHTHNYTHTHKVITVLGPKTKQYHKIFWSILVNDTFSSQHFSAQDTVPEASTVDVHRQKHTRRSNTWTSHGVGHCCSFACMLELELEAMRAKTHSG